MQYTQQQLREKYENLPEDLKGAIFSVESSDAIQKISKNYGLMIDQMGELASETGLVMLGLTHPRDYIKNLSGRLGIDIDTAKKIAQEINIEIFSKVKETLKKIHGIEEKKDGEEFEKAEEKIEEKAGIPKTEPPKIPEKVEIPKPPQETEPPKPPQEIPPVPLPKEELEVRPPSEAPAPVSALELTQKHEAEKKPEKPAPIFPEKMKEEPFRQPSQVTEIEEPLSEIKTKYLKEDPYKEPIN